jgi:O-antigen/teichoic acid export membrane protein
MNKENSVLKSIAIGSALVFLSDLVGKGTSLGVRLVAGRYLGPSDYGLIILGLTLINISSLFAVLGLSKGIAQQIPRSESEAQLFQFSVGVGLCTSIILLSISYLIAPTITNTLGDESLLTILEIFAIGIPLLTFVKISIGGLRGFGYTHGRVLVENTAYRGVTFLMVVSGVYLGFSVVGIAFSWVVGLGLAAMLSLMLLRRKTPLIDNLTLAKGLDRNGINRLLSVSVPLVVSNSAFFLMRQSDNLLIGYFSTVVDVGIYDASFTLTLVLLMFTGSIGYLFMPYFSHTDSNRVNQDLERLYKIVSKWVALAALPLFFLMVAWPTETLTALYDADYASGSLPLILLATGSMVSILTGINGHALTAIGRSKQIMYGNIIGFILNTLMNVMLIPVAGITGAAVASGVSFSISNLYYAAVLWRVKSLHPVSLNLLKPLSLMILIAFAVSKSDIWSMSSDLVHLSLTVLVIYILELVVIVVSRSFDEEDKRLLEGIM